jgi:hypothetical protein
MIQILNPVLRNLVLGFLALTRCRSFVIEPQQRSILTSSISEQDDTSIITMKEVLSMFQLSFKFDEQIERFERRLNENLTATSK